MSSPRLLMLDEPSLGLAPALVDQIFELIARLHQRGVTILLVEQNVDRTLEIVDRAYLLNTGLIESQGTAEQLRSHADIEGIYLGDRRARPRNRSAALINLEFIINALSLGSLYAMLALGLVIVYGILKLVNFAYGELIMVGGYALYLLTFCTPLPWLVMAILAVAAAMLTSLFTELVAFRPVREKSLTAMLITSFAVSTLLQNAALLIISPRARAVTLPQIFQTSVMIAGTSVPMAQHPHHPDLHPHADAC